MKINSNHSNQAFNREIDNCKIWLQNKTFDACGYPSGVLLDCLVQRIAEMGHYPYALAVSILCKTSENCFPLHGAKISCTRVHGTKFSSICAFMEIGSGRVIITLKQWLSNQLEFFSHWVFCLIAILTIKKTSENLPAVLVFGISEESLFKDGNDERFIKYCRFGPVTPLRNGKRFFIQSASKNVSSSNSDVTYSKYPLMSLLHEARLGCFGRFQLAIKHVILFFAYVLSTFRLPQLSLLGKEFAYSCISFELDKRGLIESIVLTCSNYTNQPLWLRELHRSNTHMIWYAQNWRPIAYSADKVVADLPQLRWIRVDTHWVWTHAFAEYLKELGNDKVIKVVGPIVWRLPEINVPVRDAIEIVIFDTPAFTDEIALWGGGEITNYNHPNNLRAFIKDIASLKTAIEKTFYLPIFFRLKTKRGYCPTHDRGYFDYLEKLNSLGVLTLEDPSINIYSLISRSHLVISYPFSSAAYVAEALNVSTIYYDPTKTVFRQDFSDSHSLVNFANCPEELLKAAISALSNTFPIAQ